MSYQIPLITIFSLGYLGIIFEHVINIHKTATALIVMALCWGIYVLGCGSPIESSLHHLHNHLSHTSQIVFFLIGAMTIVELIDSHKGFSFITRHLQVRCRRKMLWFIGFTAFFLSAILDNLTTTIAMISIIRKITDNKEDRWLYGSLTVIAANAGGAWTPIGDVTTTMLWVNGQLTTFAIIKSLFLPSLVSLIAAIVAFRFLGRQSEETLLSAPQREEPAPNSTFIFFLGIGMLIFVPLFKAITHLPPYMGMLISLGVMWVVTDLLHVRKTGREHLKVNAVLGKIDLSSALFFTGILLTIASLETAGILDHITEWMQRYLSDERIVAGTIGITSSIVDNVPLVAACMSMYKLEAYPVDSPFWQMIAFCSGTGGSLLIIGSAAGVAFMGLEKVDFFWYFKKISLIALVSYLAGLGAYLLL